MWLKKTNSLIFFLLCLSSIQQSFAQDTATYSTPVNRLNKKRLATVVATEAILYSGTLIALNELWYKDYAHSPFHMFDDNNEWLQMDKMGHVVTSYSVGRVGIDMLKWSGVERKKAIWLGGMLGSVFLNTVEVLDGYSGQWGFSVGDLSANTLGSLLVIGEELAWDEQRIVLKYSFQQSPYAKYRPAVLGKNLQENLIKDYNGQTYWMSVNLSSFMKKETTFPRWLNVALGHGANGLIGARSNPALSDVNGNPIYFERYRQFYISLDVDLTRIKTRSDFLRTVFKTIGFIKFPAPAIEFNKNTVKVLPLGF